MQLKTSRNQRAGLFLEVKGASHAPDWANYVVSKVKSAHLLGLAGHATWQSPALQVPKAIGVIELRGARIGLHWPVLVIGFSAADALSLPSFTLGTDDAVGTMVLPAIAFAAYANLVQLPSLHLRVGGDGMYNAVGSEATCLASA